MRRHRTPRPPFAKLWALVPADLVGVEAVQVEGWGQALEWLWLVGQNLGKCPAAWVVLWASPMGSWVQVDWAQSADRSSRMSLLPHTEGDQPKDKADRAAISDDNGGTGKSSTLKFEVRALGG